MLGLKQSSKPLLESLESRLLLAGDVLAGVLAKAAAVSLPRYGTLALRERLKRGDSQVYRLSARDSAKVGLTIRGLTRAQRSRVKVFDENGQLLRGSRLTNTRWKFSAAARQTFYVLANARRDGNYRLRLAITPLDKSGDTLEEAATLALDADGSRTVTRMINVRKDQDWFRLTAVREGTMQATMAPTGGASLPCRLAVYDADGALLAEDLGEGSSAAGVTFNVDAGQTYYLKAYSSSRGRGLYRLGVTTYDRGAAPEFLVGPYEAQDSVVAARTEADGQQLLVVLGTDRADEITLSYRGGTWTIAGDGGTLTVQGAFDGVVLYGFGGGDVLRLDHSISVAVTADGGDGRDTIYAASRRSDTLLGGAGDDTIVAIGGGRDSVFGGSGFDSLWVDGVDTLSDVSVAEAAAGAIHVVTAFYQPWTTNSASDSYVSLELAGQDLKDPSISGWANGYANFSNRPVFADGAQYDDVAQGGVGNCYFLATLAGLADTAPATLEQAVTALGDGTFAVRFYRGGQEVYVRIDGDLPVYSGNRLAFAQLGPDNELWVALMEKAYAFVRSGKNSYASLNGGWMAAVFKDVVNRSSDLKWTDGSAAEVADYIRTQLNAGRVVTVGSNWNASGKIVGSHAYHIRSISGDGADAIVTVYNPWGVDGARASGDPSDGLITLTMSEFKSAFFGIVTASV